MDRHQQLRRRGPCEPPRFRPIVPLIRSKVGLDMRGMRWVSEGLLCELFWNLRDWGLVAGMGW